MYDLAQKVAPRGRTNKIPKNTSRPLLPKHLNTLNIIQLLLQSLIAYHYQWITEVVDAGLSSQCFHVQVSLQQIFSTGPICFCWHVVWSSAMATARPLGIFPASGPTTGCPAVSQPSNRRSASARRLLRCLQLGLASLGSTGHCHFGWPTHSFRYKAACVAAGWTDSWLFFISPIDLGGKPSLFVGSERVCIAKIEGWTEKNMWLLCMLHSNWFAKQQ